MKEIACKVILVVLAIMCTSATASLLCNTPVLNSTLCFGACAGFPSHCTDDGTCVCYGSIIVPVLNLRVTATCDADDPGLVCNTVCLNLEGLGLGTIAHAECINDVCYCFYL